METSAASYQARIQSIAEDYRNRGYEVVLEPSREQLPDFLADYQPDIVAHRGDEHVVVEVKSRQALGSDTRLRELAHLVQSRPGWSFEFVAVRPIESSTPEDAQPFSRDDVIQGVEESERLLGAGSTEAALLLTWALAEATLRLLAAEEGVELQRLSPAHVLKQTVSEGVISREEYDFLTSAMRLRNAWGHGFRMTDADPKIVRELLDLTKRLLGLQPA